MVGFDVIVDTSQVLKLFKQIRKNSKPAAKVITDRIGRRFKKELNMRINALPYHGKNMRGHNTPQSLKKTIHYHQYQTGRLNIWMQRRGRGVNPAWVEFGTKPHEQPTNPFFTKKMHPGSPPKYFFSRSIEAIKNSDAIPKAAIAGLKRLFPQSTIG